MLELLTLIHQCAPYAAPETVKAVIQTESRGNPLALNVNGKMQLQYLPRTFDEAVGWANWLINRGYSVDLGLMQINSHNLTRFNMTPADAFDPCRNIQAGTELLTEQYTRAKQIHGEGNKALLHAISAYNTGNFQSGFHNGYVDKVVTNALGPPPPAHVDQNPNTTARMNKDVAAIAAKAR